MRWVLSLILGLLVSAPPVWAADGTFRGKVIDPPANAPAVPGWIFVQGQNRMLRRVEVAHAVVVFGDEVPARQRHKCDSQCLSAGQEVRVTARQDLLGEWRAKRVEILRFPTQVARIPRKITTLPIFTPNSSFTPNFGVRRITMVTNCASHPYTGEIYLRNAWSSGIM
jgi:hypothetical protein